MSTLQSFEPDQDQVVRWTVAATSEAKRICSGTPGQRVQVRLVNNGTEPVHIKAGEDDEVAALATDMTVLAGVTEVLTYPIAANGFLYLAVIGSGATGTFEATGGRGL